MRRACGTVGRDLRDSQLNASKLPSFKEFFEVGLFVGYLARLFNLVLMPSYNLLPGGWWAHNKPFELNERLAEDADLTN